MASGEQEEVPVPRSFLGGWRWKTCGTSGQQWHNISCLGDIWGRDQHAQHWVPEKLHHDSQNALGRHVMLSWGMPISALKSGQEKTHLVLPREMTFKIFWWTEFILNLSTQSKKLPAVQRQAALPPRLSCPIMLHGSRASQPLSEALKMSKEATFSPKDPHWAQLDRARRNGTPLPMCRAGFLFTQTQKPRTDWTLVLPTGREATPGTAVQTTLQKILSTLPILRSCSTAAFWTTSSSANSLAHGPHSAKMLPTPHAKGNADQPWPSLKISYFTANLLRCISDAWCIKRVSVFKVCQYSMNKL